MQSERPRIGFAPKMGSAVMMPINADRVVSSRIVSGSHSEILFGIREIVRVKISRANATYTLNV